MRPPIGGPWSQCCAPPSAKASSCWMCWQMTRARNWPTLLGSPESLRLYDESYHDEMRWWTTSFSDSEGVPYSSLVSEAEGARVGVHRDFPVSGHGQRRAQIPQDEAKILALSTPEDTRSDALRCGEALSAVLLDDDGIGDLHLDAPDGARDQPASR